MSALLHSVFQSVFRFGRPSRQGAEPVDLARLAAQKVLNAVKSKPGKSAADNAGSSKTGIGARWQSVSGLQGSVSGSCDKAPRPRGALWQYLMGLTSFFSGKHFVSGKSWRRFYIRGLKKHHLVMNRAGVVADDVAGRVRRGRKWLAATAIGRALDPAFRYVRALLRRLRRYIMQSRFSTLTWRILGVNFVGLLFLIGGIFYMDQFRAGLVEIKAESLFAQGEIIARTIAWSAAARDETVKFGPDSILKAQTEQQPSADDFNLGEFPIDPERAAPLLQRIVKPTGTRARIYDRFGTLILDTDWLYSKGQIMRVDLPPVEPGSVAWFTRLKNWFYEQVLGFNQLKYKDIGAKNGKNYYEVRNALSGISTHSLRVDAAGEHVVVVAVPIQHLRAVLGVLLLSTSGKDISATIAKERWRLIRFGLLAAGITLIMAFGLANSIGKPMRSLAAAADRVRTNIKTREQIPEFANRSDEIGQTARAFRDMTDALFRRLDSIESFASDVAHELKNPLTSLRSAADTLELVKDDTARQKLIRVIRHDVQRLDRLITDISGASRLDAELALTESERVDMVKVLGELVPICRDMHGDDGPDIKLVIDGGEAVDRSLYMVLGHELRIGQVITNIIDNAVSFSPKGGEVSVTMRRVKRWVEIVIDDQGPGIPPDNLRKVFKRFYTDRPGGESFGRNSGLGLNISEQIVLAHKGRIWAENRFEEQTLAVDDAGHDNLDYIDEERKSEGERAAGLAQPSRDVSGRLLQDDVLGARFVVRLPALNS